ncbi:MAG: WecB/TagA/CpsF family glycosyltransferase [Peptoniphilus sp.]|nr:WecB/TagA/CpsF family glycosyltransferase [Peptoniphilus sp.]MDY3118455.1 WecB/TagA/CpsF family glycosyltransferase [Peptoniphilus sp.]
MSSSFYNPKEKIRIFNTLVDPVTESASRDILSAFLEEDAFHWVFTPNTEIVMALKDDEKKANRMNEADLSVPDGIGLVIGSKIVGHPLKERVTGYDLSIYLLELAREKGKHIFFLGGEPGIASSAKARVEAQYGSIVCGEHHGYFKGAHRGYENSEEEAAVIRAINESGADILFVGLGFPKQEQFILNNKEKFEHVTLAIGNGGVLDILAGKAKRAPKIFIRLHLEWFYRLVKNPSRLSRQVAIPKFLWEIVRNKKAVTVVKENRGGTHAS